jgi:Uma2 family endonuclease
MASSVAPPFDNVAELLERLGNIPAHRVRLRPPPGQATERDVIAAHDRENRLFELVDGTLVEKVMGFPESIVALGIGRRLGNFAEEKNLGVVAGADGMVRLFAGLVRIPDVAFVNWDKFPSRKVPAKPIPELAPDLAVEVLSESNTPEEMERKLKEYFLSGVRRVWFVDQQRRSVKVFTSPDQSVTLDEQQTLDGGDVLPGLSLPVALLFENLEPPAKPARKRRSPRRKS